MGTAFIDLTDQDAPGYSKSTDPAYAGLFGAPDPTDQDAPGYTKAADPTYAGLFAQPEPKPKPKPAKRGPPGFLEAKNKAKQLRLAGREAAGVAALERELARKRPAYRKSLFSRGLAKKRRAKQ